MADSDNNSDNNSTGGSNSGGTGDAAPVDNDENDTINGIKQTDEPVAPVSTATAATEGEGAGSDQGNQTTTEKSRDLSKETPQKEVTPELSVQQKVDQLMSMVANYNLRPEMAAEVANGITGPVMAGINVTLSMLDNVVKNVDPMAHMVKHAKDAASGLANAGVAIASVASTEIGNLVSPLANMAKQQSHSQESVALK